MRKLTKRSSRPSSSPCCPPRQAIQEATTSCCSAPESSRTNDLPGYRIWSFVTGWQETPVGRIPQVSTALNWIDRTGRWQMRWGIGRSRYGIAPGIYATGTPNDQSPVLVSANYKMSFDILRRSLNGLAAWILVIDTKGINVWCAAGKGTFGTKEIVRRVRDCGLDRLVRHRTLIVPQLGAPGVAAHQVKKDCGFRVVYGPVRAEDIKTFLAAGMTATAAMRRVTFSTMERLVLAPVELTSMFKPTLWAALVLFILGGIGTDIFSFAAAWNRGGTAVGCLLTGILAGAVGVPILLPWLPGRAFALKGALFGLLVALLILTRSETAGSLLETLALLLALPAVSSYCAMNFTGSTTYTSPSGVEKEMRRAIPGQLAALLFAGLCWIGAAFP